MGIEEQLKKNFENSPKAPSIIEPITSDFMPVDVDESPSKGMYFQKGISIMVKSLSTGDVKNYSKMNPKSLASVDKHMDAVMSNNIRITNPDGSRGNHLDLIQFDKIHYLFMLREATMRNFSSKKEIYQMVKNPNKPSEEKKVLINQNVFEYFEIPSGVMKYYDHDDRCFHIFDDSQEPVIDITLYMPTVGTVAWIKEHVTALEIRKHNGEEIFYDENFIKYLQFMVKDWRMLNEEYMEELKKKYESFSIEENEVFIDAIDKISVGIKPTIKVDFDGKEIKVPLNFRNYRDIFSISNRSRDLLSDTK